MFHDPYERINFWSHAVPGAALLALAALASWGECLGSQVSQLEGRPACAGAGALQGRQRALVQASLCGTCRRRCCKVAAPQPLLPLAWCPPCTICTAAKAPGHGRWTVPLAGRVPGGVALAAFCCCAATTHLLSALTHVWPDSHSLVCVLAFGWGMGLGAGPWVL